MIRVQLRVLAPASSIDDDRGEDWREWDFISLPQAGDHIDLNWNDVTELLTVRRVIHFAAQNPMPRSETPYRQRKEPSICIVAVRAT
jgi:hypothetical protein